MNLTELVQNHYNSMRTTMENRYTEVVSNIINSQLSDNNIIKIVEKEMENSKNWKSNYLAIYLILNLRELYLVGVEESLWTLDITGKYIIDFSLPCKSIRNMFTPDNNIELSKLYEERINKHKIMREFIEHLTILFPEANVSSGHCRWFETSGDVEYWIQIQIKLR